MLYRIDWEHFLTHAIDHFTREDLLQLHFAVISAGITCGGHYGQTIVNNNLGIGSAAKITELFPPPDIYEVWNKYEDKDMIREAYFDHIKQYENDIYLTFIRNILNHADIVIICRRKENVYIDLLCEFMKEKYTLDTIDLNKLFIEGRCGPFSIDLKEIHNNAADVCRHSIKMLWADLERTKKGRQSLLRMMNKTEKIQKLKELGITVGKNTDKSELDKLLVDTWVDDE